ncbi:MAG: hypothetical protein K940chlam7_01427, partial [Chlamydiae bacterium]|nr:hypothetical protein [Chlamydiota bacterium]
MSKVESVVSVVNYRAKLMKFLKRYNLQYVVFGIFYLIE